MVEVNCETDFVARSEQFLKFAHEVALQVAAASPRYIKEEDIPAEVLEHETEIAKGRAREEGKPEAMLEKIAAGTVQKFLKEVTLHGQLFVKDDKMTIEQGATKATVHKRLVGIRDHYIIEVEGGEDLKAHGNIVDHEYEIERDGDTVATVSKKWFRVRDSYGVQMAEGQDIPLILAITVCVDAMARG